MQFDLVTPEKLLVSDSATYVSIPGSEGSFGVLEMHQPTLSTLNPGKVVVENGDKVKEYFVSFGFADVTGEKVTILTEESVLKSDINVDETTAELAEANARLAQLMKSSAPEADVEVATKKVQVLEAKLNVARA
ncbi:MAG: ATP synthase F1 subunit epsilon [Pseudomonadota bacterium]|nr:ATP synthase F1 subunit epsilon [Pseudomonadota bacterium]